MQAIQSATIDAARLMGWEDRIGSITAGKFADLVAVEGDGLADLGRFLHPALVMKGGRIYRDGRRGGGAEGWSERRRGR
jgi:imidazolonepropionase-like amidohydrolase